MAECFDDHKSKLLINALSDDKLPRCFRTSYSPFLFDELNKGSSFLPTRKGLNRLRISGSAQFSELSFKSLLEELQRKKCNQLFIIDLRQENHGFVNDMAVSWYGYEHNEENIEKTAEEIEKKELFRLSELKKKGVACFFTDKLFEEEREIAVKTSCNEQQIAHNLGVNYKRFFVCDHRRPDDETIDAFLQFYFNLEKNSWLHFHCAGGKGRTTTFMAMIDMLKNAYHLSLEEILLRQHLLGGSDLSAEPSEEKGWKSKFAKERYLFLKKFYDYARNRAYLKMGWKDWLNRRTEQE